MNITVTGPRDPPPDTADRCETMAFERYMAPFVEGGHAFFVGGDAGIDALALRWLITHRAPVTIVVPARVENQPGEAGDPIRQAALASLVEVVELRHPSFPDPEAHQARNRYMVDRSDLVIGYPLGRDRDTDTWYTLDYAASKGLPRLIVPV
jgi:hypothetical protein